MIKITKKMNYLSAVNRVFLIILTIALTGCATAPPSYPGHIDLSGARNLRDLGGYPTTDGRRIKKGLLFRSDELSKLTKHDLEILAGLKLKRIYDLRNKGEQQKDPDKLPVGENIQIVSVPFAFAELDESVMRKKIVRGKLNKGDTEKLMIESYETYVIDYRQQIALIVRDLAEPGELPALIHCVHGKDRTGLVIATILEVLGVPKDIIMQDYLLTNMFWESETSRLSTLAHIGSLFRTPSSEVRNLMVAKPEYLQDAGKEVKQHYGSIDNYIREGLGLDDATIERLRNALLE